MVSALLFIFPLTRRRLPSDTMLLLPNEHPHPSQDDLLCPSESIRLSPYRPPIPTCFVSAFPTNPFPLTPLTPLQSGQSLIEHSYKADSDLSPAGWEYAERLKAAVVARRKAAREERKARGEMLAEENPLLVRAACGVRGVSGFSSRLKVALCPRFVASSTRRLCVRLIHGADLDIC
jgi:hypothetical protein